MKSHGYIVLPSVVSPGRPSDLLSELKQSPFLTTLTALMVIFACGCADRPAQKQKAATRPSATSTKAEQSDVTASQSASSANKSVSPSQGQAPPTPDAKVTQRAQRAPIYDTSKSGQELIAAALARAQRDRKHVLIEWGGNWCSWCHKLHDLFTHDEQVRAVLYLEFELVLVDSNQNNKLMLSYAGTDRQYSYPHLTVLDSAGHVLTNQNTEPLEKGDGHSPEAVNDFLRKWMPQKVDAAVSLDTALKQAASQNKRVFLHVGTPYCSWCKILSQFLLDHSQLFSRDYIDLPIDLMRMDNAEAAVSPYKPDQAGGVPWFVILDASGKSLASSTGSDGNIGYPYEPKEVAQFMEILRATRVSLSDEELESISADLMLYRSERENRLQKSSR